MKTFVTSDHHFGHENIIRLCDRPFKSVEEMDEVMTQRWNEVVGPDDDVWHLGDFSYKGRDPGVYRAKLNGRVHLIRGNHDKMMSQAWWIEQGFVLAVEQHVLLWEGKKVHLFHYPIRDWNGYYRGGFHLFGHSHGRTEAIGRSADVGVDCHDFRPVPLDRLLTNLSKLENPIPEHKWRRRV